MSVLSATPACAQGVSLRQALLPMNAAVRYSCPAPHRLWAAVHPAVAGRAPSPAGCHPSLEPHQAAASPSQQCSNGINTCVVPTSDTWIL